LPYAVETAVEIESKDVQPDSPFTKGSLVNGVLVVERKQVAETLYSVRNKSGKAHVLYLDHPKAGGAYALVAPSRAHDELPAHDRFEVQVPETGGAELRVREEQPTSVEVQVATMNPEQIRFWSQQTYLSDATRALLASAAE